MNRKIDLEHFLKLAAAQVRHRVKIAEADPSKTKVVRTLRLLEDLINEQGQTNENSRSAAGPTG